MSVRIITGDALTELRKLPVESVHCCVTSPPYYGLRDYGVAGQLGLEAAPDEYVAAMVGVFREMRRVLRSDGTLWLNIGDSYANDGKWGGHTGGKHVKALHDSPIGRNKRYTGYKPKDLIGIPWLLAFALRADGWWLRQDIIWAKPNPMPESVTDRCTKAHEYLFLLSKSERYHYDAAAIAETSITEDPRRPYTSEGAWQLDGRPAEQRHGGERRGGIGSKGNAKTFRGGVYTGGLSFDNGTPMERDSHGNAPNEAMSRNKRSVWTIATAPFPSAHFATFPPALVEPCILAGCPVGGTVLDPFLGAGTTALVADRLGRTAIGIELNESYALMAKRRIERDAGLFAEVA
jgi:DNA modification methylase